MSGSDVFELEVPAGKWVSRFMAETPGNEAYLCHTLINNVSLDFKSAFGNSISIKWNHAFSDASNDSKSGSKVIFTNFVAQKLLLQFLLRSVT